MKTIKKIKVGRKSVSVYFENFSYYQPNDHVCGDCGIRAVSGALGISWHAALDKLVEKAHLLTEAPGSTDTIGAVLEDNGFKWVAIDVKNGGKRPTVHEFMKDRSGTYVLRVSNHVVCGIDGQYKDIWDCGYKCLYGYWMKK